MIPSPHDARLLTELSLELSQLDQRGQIRALAPTRKIAHSPLIHGPLVSGPILAGSRRELVDLTSWDYLDLRLHPKRIRAMVQTLEEEGTTTSSARTLSGSSSAHHRAEERLASFLATGAALLFSSRTQALLSMITALVRERDIVFVDELSPSPVTDAALLVGASVMTFTTDRLELLEAELARSKIVGRRFLFVDSLSALTGMVAPIAALCAMAQRTETNLIVDESYALGALGIRGAGILELAGISSGVLAVVADLSRGLASCGGAVASSPTLCNYLIARSRTFSAEVPLPAVEAEALTSAIELVELAHLSRVQLGERALALRVGLTSMGYKLFEGDGPVVALRCSKTSEALRLSKALKERGFLVDSAPSPLPRTQWASVRFVLTNTQSNQMVNNILGALSEIKARVTDDAN